ncbi:MAG: endonuclease V [Brevinematia bacterium]
MDKELIKKILSISQRKEINEAIDLQRSLFARIKFDNPVENVSTVSGVDISYDKDSGYCAIVTIDFHTFEILEVGKARKEITFPYIPGLLFYREFPVFYEAFKNLKHKPDLLMFDGHGLSHPKMMGIATMSGIVVDIPSIGCAKSPLYGEYREPEEKKFSSSPIKNNDNVVGFVLRSKERCKPIFISSGYNISPESALNITRSLITQYRLPLPTYFAHKISNEIKNG